jgi:sialic acid synthase SpsE
MPSGVKTPTKKKMEVIKSYVQTDSFNATAKETGVNPKTCKRIVEENPKEYMDEKERFIETTTRLINKALGKLDEKLDDDNNSLSNITTAIGTLYDKRALAKGESTSNENIIVQMSPEIKELSE